MRGFCFVLAAVAVAMLAVGAVACPPKTANVQIQSAPVFAAAPTVACVPAPQFSAAIPAPQFETRMLARQETVLTPQTVTQTVMVPQTFTRYEAVSVPTAAAFSTSDSTSVFQTAACRKGLFANAMAKIHQKNAERAARRAARESSRAASARARSAARSVSFSSVAVNSSAFSSSASTALCVPAASVPICPPGTVPANGANFAPGPVLPPAPSN